METIVQLKCPRCGQMVTSFESFRDPGDPEYLRDPCGPCDDEMGSVVNLSVDDREDV